MKSILIKDTTREEREQIVRQSLWDVTIGEEVITDIASFINTSGSDL